MPRMTATIANYLWLATFSTALAAGQILFKQVSLEMQGKSLAEGFLAIARIPTLYGAIALYGAATMLWIWILSRVPLSQAYPWVALAMAGVPVLASFVFHERVGNIYWLGIVLVIFGLLLTQLGSKVP